MREAVSFGQSPCLFLVYGPGFQVPVSVSVYCVLSGTVFCSDVSGFAWSGCCALVDAVACICICCCGCARCIRLWSCHLYLVLFICSVICLLSASWSVHLYLVWFCILLHRHLYLFCQAITLHLCLFCQAITLLLYLCTALYPVLYPSVPVIWLVWSCPCYIIWSLYPVLYPAPVICSALSGPVTCSGALYLTCSCSGCCSSWSCILVPVRCPVWSDLCLCSRSCSCSCSCSCPRHLDPAV